MPMKKRREARRLAKAPTPSTPTGWSAVKVADEVTGKVSIFFTFPTTSGKLRRHEFPKIETDKASKMIAALRGYEAVFPVADNERETFITKLLPPDKLKPLQGTRRPGFTETGKGFVLGPVMLGDAIGQKFWLGDDGPESLGFSGGSPTGYKKLTKLLQHTSFGTLGVLAMLASAVPKYLKLRGANVKGVPDLIPETATFNFTATSGAGKTLPSRIAASVSGHPDNHGTWEGSRRGVEEYLHSRNEVGAIFDDLEKTTEKHLNLKGRIDIINQCVPAGKSKVISASARKKDLPALTWQTFALSSSPQTIDTVIAGFPGSKPRSNGEKVRLIDLAVPDTAKGGFVDERPIDRKPIEFGVEIATEIEAIISENYGHLFAQFIDKLIKLDLSKKIVEQTNWFVKKVTPGGDSYDIRFAKKFGVIYAAGAILEHYKLVAWPKGWAYKAIERCYFNARSTAAIVHRAQEPFEPRAVLVRLMQGYSDNRFVYTEHEAQKPIPIADDIYGLITSPRGAKRYLGIFEDVLDKHVATPQNRKSLIEFLTKSDLYDGGHGKAGTAQETVPVVRKAKLVLKPRVWRLDFEEFLKVYRAAVQSGEVAKSEIEAPWLQ